MLLFTSITSAWAGTYSVPGDYPNLSSAMQGVSAGDVLLLGTGVHSLAVFIDKDLEIRGAGIDSTTIIGSGSPSVIAIQDGIDLVLANLEVDGQDVRRGMWSGIASSFTGTEVRFTRGLSTYGGGVFSYQASFDCTGCEFVDNEASGDYLSQGGGLYIEDSTTTLTDCIVSDNTASSGGGGVTLNLDTTLDVVGGEFARNNGGVGLGGDVFIYDGGTLQITGTSLYQSTSLLGGSIGTGGSATQQISLSSASFDQHSAAGGGALWVEGGTLLLQDCSITNASATAGWGGGLLSGQDANVEITDTTFRENSAVRGGGAHLERSSSLLIRARFCDNSADGGGGLSTRNPTQQQVHNSLFLNNAASIEGGGLLIAGSAEITHSVFINNISTYGPAISAGDGTAGITNSLIGQHSGAPAIASWGPDVILTEVGFWENTAGDFEGNVSDSSFAISAPEWAAAPPMSCTDSFIPAYGGVLIDMGTPGSIDPDGSVADLGLTGGPYADPSLWADADSDGVVAMWDCDDDAPNISPNDSEVCDGLDNNCDGQVDEGLQGTDWYADTDSDGLGDPLNMLSACVAPPNYVSNSGDCDDSTGSIGGPTEVYLDTDSDGYGEASQPLFDCGVPSGYAALSGDCQPSDSTIYPGAEEVCDGFDNDCDGSIDIGATNAPLWAVDADADGHGSLVANPTAACAAPPGMVSPIDDCDDFDNTIYTGAAELCDGIDNDCDGFIDEDVVSQTWFIDADADGYGDQATATATCAPSSGEAVQGGDCDDGNSGIYPGALEVCDGVDNDCDDQVDIADPDLINGVLYYLDQDGDGFGDAIDGLLACVPPSDRVTDSNDCDDDDPSIYPGATEVPNNGIDEDCDGLDQVRIETADTGPFDTGVSTPTARSTGCRCNGVHEVAAVWRLLSLGIERRR